MADGGPDSITSRRWCTANETDQKVILKAGKGLKPEFIRIKLSGEESNKEIDFLVEIATAQRMKNRLFAFEGGLNLPQWDHCDLARLRIRTDAKPIVSKHGCDSRERTKLVSNCPTFRDRVRTVNGVYANKDWELLKDCYAFTLELSELSRNEDKDLFVVSDPLHEATEFVD